MREEGFGELWAYLCDLERQSAASTPLAIHSRSGDWTEPSPKVIGGMPFSSAFLRRVDHVLPVHLADALASLRPLGTDQPQIRSARRSQWRIVAGVLKRGLTDSEACRTSLHMSEWQFRIAGEAGIRAFRSHLERSYR